MKKLIIRTKLFYYSIIIFIEEVLEKLRGEQTIIDRSNFGTKMERQKQNEKLRRGIAKLTKKLYKDGKFNDKLALKTDDALELVDGYKKTYTEKIQEARVIDKMLRNPTDDSNTTNQMVAHNVRNARKYELETRRRDLCKTRSKAMARNDVKTVFALNHSINKLNLEIKTIKEQ